MRNERLIPARVTAMLASGAMLAGCATTRITTQYDPEASFSGIATYGWIEGREPDAATGRASLERMIRQATETELSARGLRLAAPGAEPSILVNYHLAADSLLVATTFDPYGIGAGERFGPDQWNETRETAYLAGTLILDVVSPRDRSLMWRGVAEGAVPEGPENADRAIRDAVQRMLRDFPPGS